MAGSLVISAATSAEEIPSVHLELQRTVATDQPQHITVITEAQIRALGLQNIPEILEMVPGFMVAHTSGWSYSANYHGGPYSYTRRVLVRIDDVPIIQPGLTKIEFETLPLSVEDIDRVEVVRGPSTSNFDINAAMATVNIYTKKASYEPGRVVVSKGVGAFGGTDRYYQALSGHPTENLSLFGSVVYHQRDGYDTVRSGSVVSHDSSDLESIRGNVEFSYQADAGDFIEGVLRYGANKPDRMAVSGYQEGPTEREQDHYLSSLTWEREALGGVTKVLLFSQQEKYDETWFGAGPSVLFSDELRAVHDLDVGLAEDLVRGRSAVPSSVQEMQSLLGVQSFLQQYGPAAYAPLSFRSGTDYIDTTHGIEMRHKGVAGPLMTYTGAGYIWSESDSVDLYQGTARDERAFVFGNAIWTLTQRLTVNLGGNLEKTRMSADEVMPSVQASIRYDLTDSLATRLSYSSAYRPPNAMESRRRWQYFARDSLPNIYGDEVRAFYYKSFATENLDPERMEQVSVSMMSRSRGLDWNISVFHDQQSSLISENPSFFAPLPTNDSDAHASGFEFEGRFELNDVFSVFGSGAYVDRDTSEYNETLAWWMKTYHLGVQMDMETDQFALRYVGASGGPSGTYGRFVLSGNRYLRYGDWSVRLFGVATYFVQDEYKFLIEDVENQYNAMGIDDQSSLTLGVEVTF